MDLLAQLLLAQKRAAVPCALLNLISLLQVTA
jgi:hypothetical protein